DKYLPVFYEIVATMSSGKPTGGWGSNSYVLFDYWSPTDFKFAGFDTATNKMVIGHRTPTAWVIDAQSPFNGSLKPDQFYNLTVDVNGTAVTVLVNNQSFTFTFGPRILDDGTSVALNKGLVGFGSNNSIGTLDNVAVQSVYTGNTLDATEYFEDGTPDQFTGPASGTWSESTGRDVGSAGSSAYSLTTSDYGTTIQPTSGVTVDAVLNTNGIGGIAFDTYGANDFKFAALNVLAQQVEVGHVAKNGGWVVQSTFAATLTAGTDYTL